MDSLEQPLYVNMSIQLNVVFVAVTGHSRFLSRHFNPRTDVNITQNDAETRFLVQLWNIINKKRYKTINSTRYTAMIKLSGRASKYFSTR